MTDKEREKLEEALKALRFFDEPELDTHLLRLTGLPGCTKDCDAAHCGGKTGDCPNQRICDGKCLQRGGCIKQSETWCAHQDMACPSKDVCSPKCQVRGIPL